MTAPPRQRKARQPAAPPITQEQEHVTPGDVGPRAAWRYLGLAWHALMGPLFFRLPTMSSATRTYLAVCTVLYGFAASTFFFHVRGVSVPRTGLIAVDGSAMHAFWGLTALFVCLSQIAAILNDRWTVWQICTVGTFMWASAWGVVMIALAFGRGSFAVTLIWWCFVVIHYLFIGNSLTPLPPRLTHISEGGHASPHLGAATPEERMLLGRYEQLTGEPLDTDANKA